MDKDRVINMFRISDNEKHFEVLESPSLLEYAILIMLTYGICLYFVAIIGCAATFTTKVSTCFSAVRCVGFISGWMDGWVGEFVWVIGFGGWMDTIFGKGLSR